MLKLQAMNDNIVVELPELAKEQKTETGIFLGVTNPQTKQNQGTVVAVGEGRITTDGTLIPFSIKEGDEIIFNRFAGTEIMGSDGKKYLIIKITDVLVKIIK